VSMEAVSARLWGDEPEPEREAIALHDLTVVIPARNAEHLLEGCLGAIRRARPAEYIVVDGQSGDETARLAGALGARVLSDEGRGLPAARALGAAAAHTRYVALVDADVVIPDGALAALLDEFLAGGYTALQAGLHSVGGPGYWGRALAWHHRHGRSKRWFGVVATIFERTTLLEHGFDARFLSGEDIDLRWRLRRAGAKTGVSKRVVVEHRFDDTFAFALGQWLADGKGLARMLDGHGARSRLLLGLPLAAGLRGAVLSLLKLQARWIPYFALFTLFNYVGIAAELLRQQRVKSR
jgi:glycosyltransferase involved in cell wall biosynthesis